MIKPTIEQLTEIAREIGRFNIAAQSYPQNISIENDSITGDGDLSVQFNVVTPGNTRGSYRGFVVSPEGEHKPAA